MSFALLSHSVATTTVRKVTTTMNMRNLLRIPAPTPAAEPFRPAAFSRRRMGLAGGKLAFVAPAVLAILTPGIASADSGSSNSKRGHSSDDESSKKGNRGRPQNVVKTSMRAGVTWLPMDPNQPQGRTLTLCAPAAGQAPQSGQTPLQTPFNQTPLTQAQTPLVNPVLQTPLTQTPQIQPAPRTSGVHQQGDRADLRKLVVVGRPGDNFALAVRFTVDAPVPNAQLDIALGTTAYDFGDNVASVAVALLDPTRCVYLNGRQTLPVGTHTAVFSVAFARIPNDDDVVGVLRLRSGKQGIEHFLPVLVKVAA